MQIIVLYEGKTLRSAVQLFIVYVDDARRMKQQEKEAGLAATEKNHPGCARMILKWEHYHVPSVCGSVCKPVADGQC